MFKIYYCPDQGLLDQQINLFLTTHDQAQVVHFHNLNQLTACLEQKNLFFSPTGYVINDCYLFSSDWKKRTNATWTPKVHKQLVQRLITKIVALKNEGINFLITINTSSVISELDQLLTISDNFPNNQIKPLNNQTKNSYINQLVKQTKATFTKEALMYINQLLPKNAQVINEVFTKINLLDDQPITLNELNQLIGTNSDHNFFYLVDQWLVNNHPEWIQTFHEICLTKTDANSLLQILIFKLEEYFHFCSLKKIHWSLDQIATLMKKPKFMLFTYERAYQNNVRLTNNINAYILQLTKYALATRTSAAISVENLKLFLVAH